MRHIKIANAFPKVHIFSGLIPYIAVYGAFSFLFVDLVRPLPFASDRDSSVILVGMVLVSVVGSCFLASWPENELFTAIFPFTLYIAMAYWYTTPRLLVGIGLISLLFLCPIIWRMFTLWRQARPDATAHRMERLQDIFSQRGCLLCLALVSCLFVRIRLSAVVEPAQPDAGQTAAQVFYQEVSFESLASTYMDRLCTFDPAVWETAGRAEREQACQAAVEVCCLYLGLDAVPPVSICAMDSFLSAYTDGEMVCLNEQEVYSGADSFYVFDSCAHETFHLYQWALVVLMASQPLDADDWNLLLLRRIGRYMGELADYKPAGTDDYDDQALELDAQRFASYMTGALQDLLNN